MDCHGARGFQHGQATVEYLGVVVAIAIVMFVATGALIMRIGGSGGGAVRSTPAQPLADIADELLGSRRESPAARPAAIAARIGRALVRGQVAQVRGFGRAIVDDVRALSDDPLAAFVGAGRHRTGLTQIVTHPVASVRAGLGVLRRYVGELRALGPEDAYVRMMADGGALAEQVVVGRARRLLARRSIGRRHTTRGSRSGGTDN